MTENLVQNSAEPPLLTLSKTNRSLFSSQFNVICLDTWRKCRCLASEGVWPLSTPLMDLYFSFSCFPPSWRVFHQQFSQLWSLLSGRHLMRSVWGSDWRWLGEYQTLTFLCHLTSQRPPVQVALAHILTSSFPRPCEIESPIWKVKQDFLNF